MALQLRRGTNKERLQITPVEGELIFVTDWELVQITGTSIDGGTETITFSAAHGLAVGDQVLFQSATQLGLTQNTVYYVIAAGLTTTACRLATSSGGSAINLTGGSGLTLVFARTPTTAAGVPVGTNVTALWIGDGSTPGGIAGNTQGLDDLTDVEITTPNEGQTLYYDATTALWKNTSILEVNDTSNRIEVAGDIHATGDLTLNSDTGSNDVNITFTTGRTLKWDHADQRYEFNTGDLYLTSDLIVGGNSIKASDSNINIEMTSNTLTEVKGDLQVTGNDIKNSSGTTIITFSGNNTVLSGDLQVQGQDIQSNGGTTAITLSGANVTIAGDLTVNGTTTTVNSTTLTIDDKNIELASTASPSDTTADGGGITLKGTSDKKIFWQNSDDRWYIDNGDGNNYLIPVNLTDLNDVVITSANQGQMLYFNGTNWVNTNNIIFADTNYRPRFTSDVGTSARTQAVITLVADTGATAYGDNDGAGLLFSVDDDVNARKNYAAITAAYFASGNHQMRFTTSTSDFNPLTATSITGSDTLVFSAAHGLSAGDRIIFSSRTANGLTQGTYYYVLATGLTTTQCKVSLTSGGSAVALTNGTGLDLVFQLNNSTLLRLDQDDAKIAAQTLTLNDLKEATDVSINFAFTAGNKTIKYSNANQQFEINDQLYVTGDIYTSDDKITINADDTAADSYLYFNTTENLKWDNANAKFVLSDDLDVTGSFTATGDLIANGDLYLNNDGTTADVLINFKDGPTPTNQTLKWVDSPGRFEFTTDLYAPQATFGTIDVGRTNGQIDTNSGYNLTLDSDGGTVLINDNLNVDSGVLYVDAANNYVGINDTTPSYDLDVTGDIRATATVYAANLVLDSGAAAASTFDTHTTSNLAASATGTIASTTRRAMKAVIKITEDTTGDCHMVEALLMRKGTTDTYITTYGEIYSTAALATFAADYDSGSGTLRLRATSTATNTIDINVVRVSID